ncbi:hypothetical protein L9F63_001655, partial [Diploptera punctata]
CRLYGQNWRNRSSSAKRSICVPWKNLTGTALYVESEIPHIDTELGASKHPGLRFSSHRSSYCRWRALSWHPADRFESEGAPVPPNFRIVINHVPSNRNLAVEYRYWFQTFFGMECEVSVHTYKDVHRRETSENMWMFVCQKSKDLAQVIEMDKNKLCRLTPEDLKKGDRNQRPAE